MQVEFVNYMVQNSFAIGVAIYLLYERSRLNSKMLRELNRITILMDLIYDKIK